MAGNCERTGWPIDIALSHFFFKRGDKKNKKLNDDDAAVAADEDVDQNQ